MTYEEKLEELLSIKCLTHSKKMSDQESQTFAIRGTGIFIRLTKEYISPYDPESISGYRMGWTIKLKKYQMRYSTSSSRNKYNKMSFEEVLDHKLISDKAREELLFNLDVFTGKK